MKRRESCGWKGFWLTLEIAILKMKNCYIFWRVELKKLPVKKWRWREYNFENLRIWNIIKSKFIEKVFKIDCKLREFRNFDWKDPKTWITWTQIYNANKIFTDLKLVVICHQLFPYIIQKKWVFLKRSHINDQRIVFAAAEEEDRRASRWLGRQQFLGTAIV